MTLLSKSAFAREIGVSKARVSQMLKEGKIFEVDGQIDLEAATAALKLKTDPGQRAGNGATTRLQAAGGEIDEIDLRLKREALATREAQNRKLVEEERVRQGLYCRADEARAMAGQIASKIVQGFDSGMGDLASRMAEKWQLPHRDVSHFLKHEFNVIRAKIETQLAADATNTPELVDA